MDFFNRNYFNELIIFLHFSKLALGRIIIEFNSMFILSLVSYAKFIDYIPVANFLCARFHKCARSRAHFVLHSSVCYASISDGGNEGLSSVRLIGRR